MNGRDAFRFFQFNSLRNFGGHQSGRKIDAFFADVVECKYRVVKFFINIHKLAQIIKLN